MQGDRERCLEAGMDGYLSKPIDVTQMVATIEQFAGAGAGDAPVARAAPAAPPAPFAPGVFDEASALTRTGGDRRLLKQIVRLFRTDSRASLQQIERAVASGQAEALRLAAHGLKGSAANVGGLAVREAAGTLEEIARAGPLDGAGEAVARLRTELAALDRAFVAAAIASPRRSRT
jgi:HPt (histidine-containing phosphotransfer) domain-containing protein